MFLFASYLYSGSNGFILQWFVQDALSYVELYIG